MLNLPEYLVLFVAVRCCEPLLYESRSVLVATELNDVVVNILKHISHISLRLERSGHTFNS